MKLTQILYKQNIGWHFKKHWQVQAKRKPLKTEGMKILEDKGVHLYQPDDFLKEKRVIEKYAKLFLCDLSIKIWHFQD